MVDTQAVFAEACVRAFRVLVDSHGWEDPEIEPLGREVYVRYHKGNRTISISLEWGSTPWIELFYPSTETGERPVPWAERNGVPRCRRFPRINVGGTFSDRDPVVALRYLTTAAQALLLVEHDWLST